MHHMSTEMKACIDNCLACYGECLSMAMGHCLELGGEHTKPAHFKLIMACAEICRTSAHFMLIGSEPSMSAGNAPKSAPSAPRTANGSATCRAASTPAAAAPIAAARWRLNWEGARPFAAQIGTDIR